jgi:DNA-binding response OmpR family regulator
VLPAPEEPAQIKAVPEPEPEPAELFLDVDRRVVRWKDREVPLTRLEHDFLHCLVKEPGRVWTYQRLHHAVWGNEHLGHGSHIHSVVKRLRQKLANLGAAVTIQAVRGVGFHLLPTT